MLNKKIITNNQALINSVKILIYSIIMDIQNKIYKGVLTLKPMNDIITLVK